MFYVYVLQRKEEEKRHYIGFTRDLRQRMANHQAGKACKTTKNGEWKLIYYEAYLSEKDARRRERRLKDGRAIYHLKERIRISMEEG